MILVVDAGNTKCHWMMAKRDGTTLSYRSEGISPYFDTESRIASIASGAVASFDTLPLPDSVCYYGSGCYEPAQKAKVERALRSVFPARVSLLVEEDLTGAAIALFGDGDGVAVISGTGSNAGITREGRIIKRITSLGYLLGDEGSGAHLGIRFLKELLINSLDKETTASFFDEFRLTPDELISSLYSARKPQTLAASFVPFIKRHIHLEKIHTLVDTSFGEMAEIMIKPLLSESQMPLPIGAVGGVATAFHDELRIAFQRHGLNLSKVLQAPIEAMAAYHLKKRAYG